MSYFDQVYDEMSWQEVCYRLPSELAVNALKRRITNLETLKMFFDNVGSQLTSINSLKEYINTIISNETPEDIMDIFTKDYERVLFNWLNNQNRIKIKNHEPDKLSTKLLFNVTESNDRDGLKTILNRVLSEPIFNQTHLYSVLNKADDKYFNVLIGPVLRDSRPEVRSCVLCNFGFSNKNMISDHQKAIGLKAFAKCTGYKPVSHIGMLNINIFSNLKPLERLNTLEKYLSYFPKFKKVPAFDPAPTKEEFDIILFAGCIEHNEKVAKINALYRVITELDPLSTEKNNE